MPTVAGYLSDRVGLFAPMWMAALAGVFIAVISFFYVETAPGAVSRMKKKPSLNDHLLKASLRTEQSGTLQVAVRQR